MICCSNCGSHRVAFYGKLSCGSQRIRCKDCGKIGVVLGLARYEREKCVCLNCGGEEVRIESYRVSGYEYSCKGCNSNCVIEKVRLSCSAADCVALFKGLQGLGLKESSIMSKLRHKIYVGGIGGETMIRPVVPICYVGHFEVVRIPAELIGEPNRLLGAVLSLAGLDIEEFSKLSKISPYLVETLIRKKVGINKDVAKVLEVATGIPKYIWLDLRR